MDLTLDQNNLSDEDLARILNSLYIQGIRFRQSCTSINISNNEFGKQSVEALIKFFEFMSPDNLCNLRLTNLKIADPLLDDLFSTLYSN